MTSAWVAFTLALNGGPCEDYAFELSFPQEHMTVQPTARGLNSVNSPTSNADPTDRVYHALERLRGKLAALRVAACACRNDE
jgi:hypothetical protein